MWVIESYAEGIRKKPPGRAMSETTRRANALKSKVRSGVEHVFAVQKDKMDLFVRTIGSIPTAAAALPGRGNP